jgi:ribose transport system permease protein
MPTVEDAPRADEQRVAGPEAENDTGGRTLSLMPSLEAWALPALTVAVIVFFSVLPATSGTFPTLANFRAIASSQAITAIATLSVLVPLIAEEFDLSVGANVTLSAVVSAKVMAVGGGLPAAVLAGIAASLLVGIVNGLLVSRVGVSGVIVTLGMSVILAGVAQAITGGSTITQNISQTIINIGSGQTLGVPNIIFALLVVAVAIHFLLAHTPLGRHLYMLGANRSAARLVGLPTQRLLLITFVIAGVLAGVAGILMVGVFGSANISAGSNITLSALAAAFLSAVAIKPGQYNVGGALVALTFLAVLNGGLNLAGAATQYADYVNGAALIVGVALAAVVGRLSLGGRRRADVASRPIGKPYGN